MSVTDGNLDIDFLSQVENPKISAIRVATAGGSGGTQAPTDIQVSSTSFDENAAFSATLTAVDPDSTALTFALLSDPTGGLFAISVVNIGRAIPSFAIVAVYGQA